jgi:hypothetical protein
VYVDGHPVTSTTLHSGTQVVLGGTVLRFELPVADARTEGTRTQTINIATMVPQLTVETDEYRFVVPLHEETISLGRGPDNGIVIPSAVVCEHHARLRRISAGGFTIEDLKTPNGLHMHGQRVHQQVLRSGDVLEIDSAISSHPVTLTYTALS